MNSLNWDKDFAVEQVAGDLDLLHELIDIFYDSCKKDLASMQKGIKEKNSEQICCAAHSIKGAAASLGMEAIRDIASRVEIDARAGSTVVAERRCAELEELLQKVMDLPC